MCIISQRYLFYNYLSINLFAERLNMSQFLKLRKIESIIVNRIPETVTLN